MKDTGRIRMESYKGVLYCEAYMDDEYTIDDVNSLITEIQDNYNGQTDIILKKEGSYSLSFDASRLLFKQVKAFRNFVYVADTTNKIASSEFAAQSYMSNYNTKVAATKEEAFELLKEINQA